MTQHELKDKIILIASICGYHDCCYGGYDWNENFVKSKNPDDCNVYGINNKTKYRERLPNYFEDLNACREFYKVLRDPKYSVMHSSNPKDHATMRYITNLAKICGMKMREELVISYEEKDRDKLNFRPGPYPTPIQLPPSAIVLRHSIPAYGYELTLLEATAAQICEAFLKTLDLWKD